jgi:hypothetical protein
VQASRCTGEEVRGSPVILTKYHTTQLIINKAVYVQRGAGSSLRCGEPVNAEKEQHERPESIKKTNLR